MGSRYTLRYVVRLGCPGFGPICAVPDCALAGTMVVLALRVIAESLFLPGRVLLPQVVRVLDVC